MANGRTALQAIHELDDLHSSQTLPQLHCELQPKGRRKKHSPPAKMNINSIAAAGSTTDNGQSTAASFPPGDDIAMGG